MKGLPALQAASSHVVEIFPTMMIRIALMGRSYHLAGELPEQIELPADASIDEVLQQVDHELPDGHSLPRSCLVIVSGRHLGTVGQHESCPLRDGDEVVLVAPVAGG